VIVLFSLSLMFESYSSSRSRRAIQSLMTLSPDHASLLSGGAEKLVPARDVSVGDTIVVRPGERIALDGTVVQGSSFVDQSPITGESTRVAKEVGAAVFAGSISERGSIQVRVTRRFEDTTLARIIHLVEEAQLKRAPVQTFVEMFARVYTPIVLGTAVLVAVLPPLLFHAAFIDWLYRALVLLVIACPCALVISTPVAIVSAITHAARSGVLIKGGMHIETLSKVRAVAFDKTGTMTEGKPKVTDIIPLDSLAKEEILRLAAALEHRSEHHLATAVLAEAARLSLRYSDVTVEAFEAIPGMGVSATIAGTTYHLGNHELCEQRGFCSPAVEETLERLSHEGKTAIVLGRNREALAVLAIRDVARHDSTQAIKRLKALGIQHTVLLSGDENATAQRLAHEVGIDCCDAGLLPEQKVAAVEKLKERYGTVAMVGDGVNDAPALAAASVGIAMGVSGTDAALETADVVLMADDLTKLPGIVALSRKTLSIIRQNIAIALSLKLVFLILSVAGFSTLWMAVLADDGAALAVIFNGLRLLSLNTHGPGKEQP
jgi:Cd2+/Zn2+-exporting ATPase